MNILISNSSDDPIYEQIKKQIRTEIINGELSEGDSLPSIRNLARELQISVITTKRAYEDLEKEGFIDTVQGRGTFVAAQSRGFLKEKKLKIIENILVQAVKKANIFKFSKEELVSILEILWEERG